MSRHHIRLSHCGGAIVVVAGYDRPLRQLFLQVLRDEDGRHTCEDDILYDSLHEPALDWGVISTLTDKLVMLDIEVPESLIEAVCVLGSVFQHRQPRGSTPCRPAAGSADGRLSASAAR